MTERVGRRRCGIVGSREGSPRCGIWVFASGEARAGLARSTQKIPTLFVEKRVFGGRGREL